MAVADQFSSRSTGKRGARALPSGHRHQIRVDHVVQEREERLGLRYCNGTCPGNLAYACILANLGPSLLSGVGLEGRFLVAPDGSPPWGLTRADAAVYRQIAERGHKLTARMMPSESANNFLELLTKKGL